MIGNLAILWPLIVQAFLSLAVYGILLTRRMTTLQDAAAMAAWQSEGIEPKASSTVVRSLANQFELPVLFYAVCLALYVTNGASWLAVAIAWVFALSRLAHAAIHLGSNRLRQRMPAFVIGYVAVFLLWILFALHLLGVA